MFLEHPIRSNAAAMSMTLGPGLPYPQALNFQCEATRFQLFKIIHESHECFISRLVQKQNKNTAWHIMTPLSHLAKGAGDSQWRPRMQQLAHRAADTTAAGYKMQLEVVGGELGGEWGNLALDRDRVWMDIVYIMYRYV